MSSRLDYNFIEKTCNELTQKISSNQIGSRAALEDAIQKAGFSNIEAISIVLREMCRSKEIALDLWAEEDDLSEKMNRVYWNDLSWVGEEEPRIAQLFEIGQILYILGVIDLKEFRPLARCFYHLEVREDPNSNRQKLTRTLLQKAIREKIQGEESIHFVRDSYEFLGIPLPSPKDIVTIAIDLEIQDLETFVEEKSFYQFLQLIENRLHYLPELIVDRDFEEIITEAHRWISHSMAMKIMNEFLERARVLLQEALQQAPMTLKEVRNRGESVFTEMGLTNTSREPFPITYEAILQKLGAQVTPSAPLSPSRFESVPPEAVTHLLGRFSFATSIKKIELVFLGGEGIGRSGILVVTSNGSILLDFGYSIANSQIPRFVPELRFLDAILISHGHLDHSGGLPILYRMSGYQGPWYGAPSTHEIARMLLANSSEVLKSTLPKSLMRSHHIFKHITNPRNLARVHQNFIPLQRGKQREIAPNVLVTPFQAAHIYGSRSYLLEIAGTTILYTGDFNLNPTGLFPDSIEDDLPLDADYTIFDGTYYGQPPFDYVSTDELLHESLQNSERVLIPAFSLGRSQEVVQRLENAGLTREKQVLLLGMSARIARDVGLKGHYELFEKGIPNFENGMVIVTGSGMLSGRSASAVLFDEIKQDPTASVILCGWMANRTLGWDLLQGRVTPRCQVHYARLSAHSSSEKLNWFIDQLSGKKIMVHSPVPMSGLPHKEVIRPGFETRIRIK